MTETNIDDIEQHVNELFFPGGVLCRMKEKEISTRIILGNGLHMQHSSKTNTDSDENQIEIIVNRPGILKSNEQQNRFWLSTQIAQNFYYPQLGDRVIGIVTAKRVGPFCVLDLGPGSASGYNSALLDPLSFQGATKNNRPNLRVGDVVYCQLTRVKAGVDPEAKCINEAKNCRADGLGLIGCGNTGGGAAGGLIITVSTMAARKLCSVENEFPLIKSLGQIMPFEIALGMNGRIFVNTTLHSNLILLANTLLSAEHFTADDIPEVIDSLTSVASSNH